ncbi:Ig-specific serine endopeptidase MIP [Mycoplasma leonicaptivi]|uniref:Ig-specific serine endopeptidase MIP n=1 Tax=Mycoplasma leonicaptivi TaxID=36742 RepID=UPI0004822137|nr:DUF31 family protein [Mycoplasma leonicaptivi]
MKKHKIKYFLGLFGVSFLPIATISCGDPKTTNKPDSEVESNKNNNDNPQKSTNTNFYNDQETKAKTENKAFQDLFNFNENFNKTSFFPSDIENKLQEFAGLKIKDEKIKFNIINTVPNDEAGTLKLFINFGESENVKSFDISGFKQKQNNNFIVPQTSASKNDFLNYLSKNNEERFDYDYEKARDLLSRAGFGGRVQNSQANIDKYNAIAKKLKLPSYNEADSFGMSMPQYDSNGNFTGLSVRTSGAGVLRSWFDWYPRAVGKTGDELEKAKAQDVGVARFITNETYSNIALQTFSAGFSWFQFSADTNEQKILEEVFKDDQDLNILINKIKDEEQKQDFIRQYKGNEQNDQIKNIIIPKIYEQLTKDYDPSESENIKEDYWKNQQQKIIQRAKARTDLKDSTKHAVEAAVKKTYDFVRFQSQSRAQSNERGTAWILDYQLEDGKSYPTKWYFGTNYHVVDGKTPDKLQGFSLDRLNKDYPSVLNVLKTTTYEDKIDKISISPKAFRRIYDAVDVFTWDPKEYLIDKKDERKEFVDFAVFEVDFTKVDPKDYNFKGISGPEEFAKFVTNDYANLAENKKLKPASKDYLSSFEDINAPVSKEDSRYNASKPLSQYDNLYILGYPISRTPGGQGQADFFLYIDENQAAQNADQIKSAEHSYSLWTNADHRDYNLNPSSISQEKKERLNRGNWLSSNLTLRTFKDKPGVIDRFLSQPAVADKLYISSETGQEYYYSGLGYVFKSFAPGGGSSGSSVRNQNNEVVGVNDSHYYYALTNTGSGLRSQGFNFEGLYGGYNLPQYDLIYGGGKDQKTSYRQKLKELGITKTYLFPNGVEENNIPESHRFSKNT